MLTREVPVNLSDSKSVHFWHCFERHLQLEINIIQLLLYAIYPPPPRARAGAPPHAGALRPQRKSGSPPAVAPHIPRWQPSLLILILTFPHVAATFTQFWLVCITWDDDYDNFYGHTTTTNTNDNDDKEEEKEKEEEEEMLEKVLEYARKLLENARKW